MEWPTQEKDRIRGHRFTPPKDVLESIPPLYGTEGTPVAEKLVMLHYFVANADWFIVELDQNTGEAFGWAELLPDCGEWGYIYLPELAELQVGRFIVERDLYWSPQRVADIDRIAA